jgi:hypothetical protein
MTTLSSRSFDHNVTCREEEIVLTGRPQFLKGRLTLENQTGEPIFIRELPLKTKGRSLAQTSHSIQVNSPMQPGEVRNHKALLSLDAQTLPGVYHFQMLVGAHERPVRVVVLENIAATFNPKEIQLAGMQAGKTYTCKIQVTNAGNVPFDIPGAEVSPTLNLGVLFNNFSDATEQKKEKEGFDVWINTLLKDVRQDVADVKVSIKETGQILQPGKSMILNVSLTLAKNTDLNQIYKGSIPFHNRAIPFSISPSIVPEPSSKPGKLNIPSQQSPSSKSSKTKT